LLKREEQRSNGSCRNDKELSPETLRKEDHSLIIFGGPTEKFKEAEVSLKKQIDHCEVKYATT
jgi:hypothetical protein